MIIFEVKQIPNPLLSRKSKFWTEYWIFLSKNVCVYKNLLYKIKKTLFGKEKCQKLKKVLFAMDMKIEV